jgi:hypothetical protein
MKSITLGFLLTGLLATGCMPQFTFLQPDPSMPMPAETKVNAVPVTADAVTEKNAAEVGRRLREEIQKDEQSSRAGAMERSKLAIP